MAILLIILGGLVLVVLMLKGSFRRLRAHIIIEAIRQLIDSGGDTVILRNLRYEAALKFALQAGTRCSPGSRGLDDAVHFELSVDGVAYMVYLGRHIDGSTYLGLDNVEEKRREFRERLYGRKL